MGEQELRIGNLVEIDGSVLELNRKRFEYAVCKDCCSGIKPIPLTEEWLLKFGFKEVEGVFVKRYLKLLAIRDLYWRANFPIIVDVIHIHQLQNLYFALTGEELELTDK